MWRSICTAVLLPSLTFAQSQGPAAAAGNQVSVMPISGNEFAHSEYTFYSGLRRGTKEKAAVELRFVRSFVTSPRSPVPGIQPLKLELEATDGIKPEKIEYPETYKHTVYFQKGVIPGTPMATIKFRIAADRNTTLGTHILKGKLTFQVVSPEGISAPQQLDVQLPVRVVEHNAKVANNWPYDDLSTGAIIALVLLSPVLLVMFIPMALACNMGFEWGCM